MHSEKLKKLLLAARADERFDYVLLDSPPMLLSADAEALSALSDLSVLVVRQDYTPAGILNDCARRAHAERDGFCRIYPE